MQLVTLSTCTAQSLFSGIPQKKDQIFYITNRCLHVSGGFIVRICEHADNTDKDGLDSVDREPPHPRILVTIRVLSWLVQYTDAHYSVLFNCNTLCYIHSTTVTQTTPFFSTVTLNVTYTYTTVTQTTPFFSTVIHNVTYTHTTVTQTTPFCSTVTHNVTYTLHLLRKLLRSFQL